MGMRSDVDRIKERLNIVDVIGSYIKLDQAGSNYKARCPFHNEKTASFVVSPDKQIYHCFGCGRGGDVFSFVQEIEALSFRESLTLLAERAGVILHDEVSNPQDIKKKSIYHALELAVKFYQAHLLRDSQVKQYLVARGLIESTIRSFRLGYAPTEWSSLHDHLTGQGISNDIQLSAGLIIKGKKGYYDRFRNRVMFPIADMNGRVVAFTGRIFDERHDASVHQAAGKYVNSPEGTLFHKSEILYGFDKAKRSIMKEGYVILVEGQMDCCMAHQAGYENTVALTGTALTDAHIQKLSRFTDTVSLALDADPAGVEATTKSIHRLVQAEMYVDVISLEVGNDPADLIRVNPEAFAQRVHDRVDYVTFRLGALMQASKSERLNIRVIQKDIFPYIESLQGQIHKDSALKKVAHSLGVSFEAVKNDFGKWQKKHQNLGGEERTILQSTVAHDNSRIDATLMGFLYWLEGKYDEIRNELEEEMKRITSDEEYLRFVERSEPHREMLMMAIEVRYADKEKNVIERDVQDLIIAYEIFALEQQLQTLLVKLRKAEHAGDQEQVAQLLQKSQTVQHLLHSTKSKYFYT